MGRASRSFIFSRFRLRPNSGLPLPSTIGTMPRRYSSNSPCSVRVVDRLALPNTNMFLSPWRFSSLTSDSASPLTSFVFFHSPVKGSREDEFRQAVHEVGNFTLCRLPVRSHALIGDPPKQKRVGRA